MFTIRCRNPDAGRSYSTFRYCSTKKQPPDGSGLPAETRSSHCAIPSNPTSQKLTPRRNIIKQILTEIFVPLGTLAASRLFKSEAAIKKAGAQLILLPAGLQLHLRHRSDGRQGFPGTPAYGYETNPAPRQSSKSHAAQKAIRASMGDMPHPSSITRMSAFPHIFSRPLQYASHPHPPAFSTNSFTTEAGRCTTSPAAI